MCIRDSFYLTVKDTARAIQSSGMEVDNFEVRVPDVQEVPKQYLVTVEAAKNAYNGWLQEEPVSKAFLTGSALLEGVRKPPATTFKLEGLVTLDKAWRAYAPLANRKPVALTSETTPSATEPTEAEATP